MNVSFIGYRCSGKTSISNLLSELIGWPKVEIDKEIENYFNLKIPQVIKIFGWKKFRKTEHNLIKKYSKMDNIIIDLGGGAVLDNKNMKNVKKNGISLFLECSAETINERMINSYERPPLTELSLYDEIKQVLSERLPLYRKYSDYTINSDKLNLEQCVNMAIYNIRDYKLSNNYNVINNNAYAMLENYGRI